MVDNDGNGLPANDVGELLIRIGGGRRFYFGEPDSTAQTWQDGWVHTGDLGYLDADGFVYVVDRKKDMIIRGGYNIYSIEVENALYEHPAIVEAAVLGVSHQILGQDVLAVVRLAEGSSLDLGALQDFLADRLADYKHPHRLVIAHGPLPRTSLDKVDKLALRAELGLDFRKDPAPRASGPVKGVCCAARTQAPSVADRSGCGRCHRARRRRFRGCPLRVSRTPGTQVPQRCREGIQGEGIDHHRREPQL